jgi:hypothetical protein
MIDITPDAMPVIDRGGAHLSHRRFMRSQRAERKGKSPRELMAGQAHPHWSRCWDSGRYSPSGPERARLAASKIQSAD